MVSIQNIAVSFGSFDLLDGISFLVNPQDRIGLAGKNGAGKSTLLKIIAGLQSPTSGAVDIPKEVSVGYLPQQMKVSDTTTILNETLTAFAEINRLTEEIETCGAAIALREDYESAEYMKLCYHLAVMEERYRLLGGNNYMGEAEKTLTGLGFDRKDFYKATKELSGGWRMRIELAKVLLRKPSLFLLDEPTNHLDIESIQWLETFLASYQGAALLVSHDRAFLDNVTNRTIEISLGKIYDYKASWSKYVILRQERREQQTAAFRNQQKMIEDTEKFIERLRYKATKANQVQSRIKQLEKVERLEIDDEDTSAINIRFSPAPRSGTVVVEATGLSKSYGLQNVLNSIDFKIQRGEKAAFVGRNGEGKTTFAKIINGELDHTGLLKTGHNVRLGYFAQNQDELLDENKSILQTIEEVAKGDMRTKVRDILGAFLFRGDDIDKKVKVLSGGERSRLALVRLLLEPFNLLVLDEPTNHLDMRSKEILKKALVRYDGTLIVVSHDRDFLDGLAEKIYEFKNNRIKENIGGIYDFLRKKKLENLTDIERKEKTSQVKNDSSVSANKQKYIEKKEYDKNLRRLKKKLSESEAIIEKLESEIRAVDKSFMEPNSYSETSQADFEQYRSLKEQLGEEMERWAAYSEATDNFEKGVAANAG
ncbi:MAG: ABC-F family ATP-binding cassette domain-containing protein [Bacteroidales bacterium]|jgi:ATP-binding cassette subfamily F protein 3|nr:ABC-F family ATP-binding cassette domain-containing protein [Bacteroidales bacterium]